MNVATAAAPGAPGASGPGSQPRRSGWRLLRSLLWALFVFALLAVALAVTLAGLVPLIGQSVNLTVDGETLELGEFTLVHALAIGARLLLALFFVATVVPLALLVALLVALLALALGLAIALFSVFGVATLLLLPLALPLLLLWGLARWIFG